MPALKRDKTARKWEQIGIFAVGFVMVFSFRSVPACADPWAAV